MFNSELMVNMPYYAYITFMNTQLEFYGGGSLISTNHVLTCGANIHTFTQWRLGLGSNRRTTHRIFTTNRAVVHPNYAEANNMRVNDVGLIIFSQPIDLSVNIFPIFLPSVTSPSHLFPNTQGMVLGFAGSTTSGTEALDELRAAHLRIMNDTACRQLYPSADMNQHFCADDADQGSNFCLGDQGGAFTILTRNEELLVGIASLPGCSVMPSLYTRINVYRHWIQTQMQN